MRRFEMKRFGENKHPIDVMDVNVGDILYIREDKKVVAIRILGITINVNSFDHFSADCIYECAGSDIEHCEQRIKAYKSVIDCRTDTNRIGRFSLDPILIAIDAGFADFKVNYGVPIFTLYEWDGFYSRKVEVSLKSFKLDYDGEKWTATPLKGRKFYKTFEECEADHYVEVVTFAETITN